jgi:two-component system chemotaxis response regulator CheB
VAKPDGAISLYLQQWGPELVATVRSAAGARLRSSLRLKERVRYRAGGTVASRRARPLRAGSTGGGLVVVGTSTGGPPALETVLTRLPANFRWPILVAQHMPASFTGALARRLNGICALAVTEVTQLTPLVAGGVYIARGDADLVVSRRSAGLVAMPAPALPGYPWHPSTDRLVRSAMDALPAKQLIGVLMTGMGNDGAEAMTLLHERGGTTIAEAQETAVVWGMPGELAKARGADWVIPVGSIADWLVNLTP